MNIQNNETAIQNEKQLKSSKEIIDEIIKILADNIIPISHAKYILKETSKKLCDQPVVINENAKLIYQKRNRGIIKN